MEDILKRIILENQDIIENKIIIPRCYKIPKTEQICIISGPRRSGKTYLLYSIAQKVRKDRILFLDFDDERVLSLSSLGNYDVIIDSYKRLYGGSTPILFFDEIQSLKNWHLYVKRLYSHEYKIYITGSNSQLLSKEIATYLTGRGINL